MIEWHFLKKFWIKFSSKIMGNGFWRSCRAYQTNRSKYFFSKKLKNIWILPSLLLTRFCFLFPSTKLDLKSLVRNSKKQNSIFPRYIQVKLIRREQPQNRKLLCNKIKFSRIFPFVICFKLNISYQHKFPNIPIMFCVGIHLPQGHTHKTQQKKPNKTFHKIRIHNS